MDQVDGALRWYKSGSMAAQEDNRSGMSVVNFSSCDREKESSCARPLLSMLVPAKRFSQHHSSPAAKHHVSALSLPT